MAKQSIMNFRLDILKIEIELIQEKVNHFDDLRHRTKQLAVTLWAAAVGAGATTGIDLVLYLAAFIPIPFWFLDSTYHRYQEGHTGRMNAIRDFIRTGKFNVQGELEARLEESIKSDDFSSFPVPDFYGKHTLETAEHKRLTSLPRNLFKGKTLVFYTPLIAIPIAVALIL